MKLRRFAAVLWTALKQLVWNEGLELSGHVAYTALIALFPFIIFLASLAGFLGDADTANRFVDIAFRFMPDDVANTLAPAIHEVLRSRKGGLLTFGAIGTLWAASSGVEALRTALNRAYDVTEPRPIWYLRLQSIAIVIVAGLILLFVTLTVIAGPFIWLALARWLGLPEELQIGGVLLQYAAGYVFVLVAFTAFYMFLPHVGQAWRQALPGAALASALWLLAAGAFSLYVGQVGDYSVTYGSLGGAVLTLLFFYFSATIVILGAEVNAVLLHRGVAQKPGFGVTPAEAKARRARMAKAVGGLTLAFRALRHPSRANLASGLGGAGLFLVALWRRKRDETDRA